MDDNKIFFVDWLMGRWKTLFTLLLCVADYDIIYTNIKIKKIPFWKKYIPINYFEEIEELSFRENKNKKAVLIIDEAQKLLNRRLSMWKANKIVNNFAVLSRKANLDIFLIPQVTWRVDQQLLELSSNKISMKHKERYINNFGFWDIALNYEVFEKYFNEETGKIWRNITTLETETRDTIFILKKIWLEYDTNDIAEIKFRQQSVAKKDNKKDENWKKENLVDFEINI